ncbi:hypothetical protein D3C84_1083360 [compost metagenome]
MVERAAYRFWQKGDAELSCDHLGHEVPLGAFEYDAWLEAFRPAMLDDEVAKREVFAEQHEWLVLQL